MHPAEQLKLRAKKLAVACVMLFRTLPRTRDAQGMGEQLLRSSTSAAANYRAACRARSKAEFAAKLGIAVEETDESMFWLEMLVDCRLITTQVMQPLWVEANELVAIFVSSYRTTRLGADRSR